MPKGVCISTDMVMVFCWERSRHAMQFFTLHSSVAARAAVMAALYQDAYSILRRPGRITVELGRQNLGSAALHLTRASAPALASENGMTNLLILGSWFSASRDPGHGG